MGYFGAGVGGRVEADTKRIDVVPPGTLAPKPLFGAALGGRPVAGGPVPMGAAGDTQARLCPLCQGETRREDGLVVCGGRCGARWIEDGVGRLIDVGALPFGVCGCCEPRQALAGTAWGAVCAKSGKGYLLLAGGPSPIEVAAPDGVCGCCAPFAPLVWQGARLVCSRKPEREYGRKEGAPLVEKAAGKEGAGTQAELVEAIDAALKKNSAQLTVFGLFDVT